jgi:hypothetical protein
VMMKDVHHKFTLSHKTIRFDSVSDEHSEMSHKILRSVFPPWATFVAKQVDDDDRCLFVRKQKSEINERRPGENVPGRIART